jgi:hypothetical protein
MALRVRETMASLERARSLGGQLLWSLAIEGAILLACGVAVVAWVFLWPTTEPVTQPPLLAVTEIHVIAEGKFVRRLADREAVASALAFLNSKANGWSLDQPEGSKRFYEIVYVRDRKAVARLRGSHVLLELQRDGRTYTRVASVEDHVAALTSLGFSAPPEEALRQVSSTRFNEFLRALSSAWDPPPPARETKR